MLNKVTNFIQLQINTNLPKLNKSQSIVDKSAYSRARTKLKYTAFIKLNQDTVADTMYSDNDYKKWRGHRILAIDGS